MRLDALITLYERSHTQRGTSGWGKDVGIDSSHRYSSLIYGERTYAEIFKETRLDFPPLLEDQKNHKIENIDQLHQSGIFDDLIEAIKKEIQQEGYLELNYDELMEGKLNPFQQTELKFKLVTNREIFQNDPLYQPLLEALNIKPPND
jgi:hypothetical protein